MRSVRLSRARKQKSEAKAAAIVKLEEDEVNGKVPDAELTAEELLKMQEVLYPVFTEKLFNHFCNQCVYRRKRSLKRRMHN